MRPRLVASILVACSPLLCGASADDATGPDAGIGPMCRYEISGAYAARLLCFSEQQYERDADGPGAHLEEEISELPRVVVDFRLEEAAHYGIQAPSSVNGWARFRLPNVSGAWLASTSPDPSAKKFGMFAVTLTDVRTVKTANGKNRVEVHGEIDAKLVSTSIGSTPNIELHARF